MKPTHIHIPTGKPCRIIGYPTVFIAQIDLGDAPNPYPRVDRSELQEIAPDAAMPSLDTSNRREMTLRRAIANIVVASDANNGDALANAILSARDLALRSYTIELTKTIVVTIEAITPDEAIERATDQNEDWDGAWDRAEPHADTLSEKEDDHA